MDQCSQHLEKAFCPKIVFSIPTGPPHVLKGFTKGKIQKKSVTGHNFWLEWPTNLISTPLIYNFNALFRETSLAYLLSNCVCHVTSHEWRASHMSRVKCHDYHDDEICPDNEDDDGDRSSGSHRNRCDIALWAVTATSFFFCNNTQQRKTR